MGTYATVPFQNEALRSGTKAKKRREDDASQNEKKASKSH